MLFTKTCLKMLPLQYSNWNTSIGEWKNYRETVYHLREQERIIMFCASQRDYLVVQWKSFQICVPIKYTLDWFRLSCCQDNLFFSYRSPIAFGENKIGCCRHFAPALNWIQKWPNGKSIRIFEISSKINFCLCRWHIWKYNKVDDGIFSSVRFSENASNCIYLSNI